MGFFDIRVSTLRRAINIGLVIDAVLGVVWIGLLVYTMLQHHPDVYLFLSGLHSIVDMSAIFCLEAAIYKLIENKRALTLYSYLAWLLPGAIGFIIDFFLAWIGILLYVEQPPDLSPDFLWINMVLVIALAITAFYFLIIFAVASIVISRYGTSLGLYEEEGYPWDKDGRKRLSQEKMTPNDIDYFRRNPLEISSLAKNQQTVMRTALQRSSSTTIEVPTSIHHF